MSGLYVAYSLMREGGQFSKSLVHADVRVERESRADYKPFSTGAATKFPHSVHEPS